MILDMDTMVYHLHGPTSRSSAMALVTASLLAEIMAPSHRCVQGFVRDTPWQHSTSQSPRALLDGILE